MKPKVSMRWLEHVELSPGQELTTRAATIKTLRTQLIAALKNQGFSATDLDRCVYVIRMRGDFVLSYPKRWSPVLYIGRGSAFGRISSHLRRWLHEVETFGKNVKIEIRVCRPRRRNNVDLFKYVEADLIADFCARYGSIPFFNSRRETSCEGYVEYTDRDRKQLSAAVGVGSGKRPRWAIAPTPANKNYDVYYKGHDYCL